MRRGRTVRSGRLAPYESVDEGVLCPLEENEHTPRAVMDRVAGCDKGCFLVMLKGEPARKGRSGYCKKRKRLGASVRPTPRYHYSVNFPGADEITLSPIVIDSFGVGIGWCWYGLGSILSLILSRTRQSMCTWVAVHEEVERRIPGSLLASENGTTPRSDSLPLIAPT